MSHITVTFCDKCNSKQSMHPENGRGFICWPPTLARSDFGWRRVKGQDICAECQEEAEDTKA